MTRHHQGQAVHAVGARNRPNCRGLADSRGNLGVAGGLPRRDIQQCIPDALLERGPGLHDRNAEGGWRGAGEICIQLSLDPIVDGRPTGLQAPPESPLNDPQLRFEHRAVGELEQGEAIRHHSSNHRSEWRLNEGQPNDALLSSARPRPTQAAHQGHSAEASLRAWRIPDIGAAAKARPEPRE